MPYNCAQSKIICNRYILDSIFDSNLIHTRLTEHYLAVKDGLEEPEEPDEADEVQYDITLDDTRHTVWYGMVWYGFSIYYLDRITAAFYPYRKNF